jgi:hypothetical protein
MLSLVNIDPSCPNLLHTDWLSNFEQLRQPRKVWCALSPKRSKGV